ncbi:MAG: hypothetical protein A2Y56_07595 [Candidatus Aminicenantes bacterium RBG_13_63_10]|nr:MAG: hypothetical protein A2Y56_07595 [Candidatus Aminicenantes bacterium RBG_13_63_10]
MSIGRYYVQGLGDAARQPKMVFILWLLNALGGLIVFFAAGGLIRRAFGSSLLASTLSERFVFRGIMELIQHHGRDLAAFACLLLGLTAATLALSLFLSGGVLHVLKAARCSDGDGPGEERVSGRFFMGAGKYFGRFVRLEILALPLWIVFGILFFILAGIAGNLSDGWEKEQLGFTLGLALAGTAVFLYLLGRMVIDYARIHIVATDTNRVFRALAGTLGFAARKLFKMMGLYGLFVVTMVVLCAAGEASAIRLGRGTGVVSGLGFGIQQVLVLALLGVRVAFLGAQARLSLAERVSALDLSSAAQDSDG